MTRRMFIIFILFSLIIGYQFSSGSCQVYAQHEGHQLYYCPMHPTYTSDRPGDCPICNMKLVKREEAKAAAGAAKEEAGFYISPEKQQLIGVKTEKVISRPLEKIIRTVGRVVFDPDLYKAQTEYIEAIKTLEKVQDSKEAGIISRAEALVDAAELKLKLSGLSQGQVEELASIKESDKSLLLSSLAIPRSWVYATIYEYELEGVKVAQEVTITAAAYPDKKFNGEVVAIDPVFDSMTRSVRARIKVDNQEGLLKPNMYVDVELRSDMGTHLALPREAIMDTGLRKVVFVSSPGGVIQSREVKTGVSSEGYIQVVEGLKEGEDVIVSGNFLVDSESKLKAALEGVGHQPKGDGLPSDRQSHKHVQ